jgi:hypothetical protein
MVNITAFGKKEKSDKDKSMNKIHVTGCATIHVASS